MKKYNLVYVNKETLNAELYTNKMVIIYRGGYNNLREKKINKRE